MYGAPGRSADALALRVLSSYGVASQPVVDVHALAYRMGVHAIMDAPLLEDGHITRNEAGHAVIRLRQDAPPARRRFTLAHELGHLVLSDGGPLSFSAHRTRESFSAEESMCDAIASGLLMPSPWLQGTYRTWPVEFSTVWAVARAAEVSLSAALVRLRELLGWRKSLLRWAREDGVWHLEGQAGLFPSQRRLASNADETGWQLMHLGAQQPGQIVRTQLQLQISGASAAIDAEVLVRNNGAYAMLELPDPNSGSARRSRPAQLGLTDAQRRAGRHF